MSAVAENRFFAALSLAMAAFVAAGFAPSYYLRPEAAGSLAPLFIVHGAILTAWYGLAVAQPLLIAAGRPRAHRLFGAAGLGLAVGVAVSGLLAGADAMARGVGIAGRDPQTFFFLSVADAIVFLALVGAGFGARTDRSAHKRLMSIASISILFPALGRLATQAGADGALAVAPYMALLGAVAGFDLVSQRRLHPATLIGGAVATFKVAAYLPLGDSALWRGLVAISGLSVGG